MCWGVTGENIVEGKEGQIIENREREVEKGNNEGKMREREENKNIKCLLGVPNFPLLLVPLHAHYLSQFLKVQYLCLISRFFLNAIPTA